MTGVSIHNSVGVVWPCLGLQHFRQPLAFGVGMVPEVEEQEPENQAVRGDDVDEDGEPVEAVLYEEILRDVAGYHNKLDLGSKKEKQKNIRGKVDFYCHEVTRFTFKNKKREQKQSLITLFNIPAGL